jgi:hypothetical protein
MRIEELILSIKSRQYTVMESCFKTPPQDYTEFKRQLGIWIGLNECLAIIEDARKKDEDDY